MFDSRKTSARRSRPARSRAGVVPEKIMALARRPCWGPNRRATKDLPERAAVIASPTHTVISANGTLLPRNRISRLAKFTCGSGRSNKTRPTQIPHHSRTEPTSARTRPAPLNTGRSASAVWIAMLESNSTGTTLTVATPSRWRTVARLRGTHSSRASVTPQKVRRALGRASPWRAYAT